MAEILSRLNADTAGERLDNLRQILRAGQLPAVGDDVNNHIHTTYSFSPYSPTAAAYMARVHGLCTAGIMDHDTIAGAREFIDACEMLGIGGTCGVECRVHLAGTAIRDRRTNNPDQRGLSYMMLHAVPHTRLDAVDAFFAPLRAKRNDRNRAMTAKLNEMLTEAGISIDFDRDVLPLSQYAAHGVVTERHLSSALANALETTAGRGDALVRFIEKALRRPVGEKYRRMFCDADNPYFHYDLIGWIKAELVPAFYIDATDECVGIREMLAFGESVGAITAYGYLGDVGDSVTGDKRAQKFEDDYLDELFDVIKELGFRGVTYMPARNTRAQVDRLRAKIAEGGLFEISGEDINQPRQPFICMAMRDPAFFPLRESAFAMVAHERAADGLFSVKAAGMWPDLSERVEAFAEEGRRLGVRRPTP
ncbi:MAG: PHP domain-containing protein [Clostridia bacterium]|nr:PHP domain-containing protein [Clostridia bacterium]